MIFKKKDKTWVYVIVGIIYNNENKAGWVSDRTVNVYESYRKAIKEIRAIEKRIQHYCDYLDLEVTMNWKPEYQTLEVKYGDKIEDWIIYEKEVK